MILTRISSAMAIAAMAFVSHHSATAQVVFSESFEAPVVSGYVTNTVPSNGKWIGSAVDYGSSARGLYRPNVLWPTPAPFTTPFGEQAFFCNYANSGLTTAVGATGQTLTAGVNYQVTFHAAASAGYPTANYGVELVAFGPADDNNARKNCQSLQSSRPGTVLAFASGSVTTTDMSSRFTISYKPDVGNAYLGKDLAIRLLYSGGTSATSVLYDNIRLIAGHDMNPSPANGENLKVAGNVTLGWTNMPPVAPSTTTPVDVWFGSNPAALTQVVDGQLVSSTAVSTPSAGTWYWRVDSYPDGNANGTPVSGQVFSFTIADTDGDGIPDVWETQYFGSATGANANADTDTDGLTNLQEFTRGTLPLNPDTDADGLLDGVESATGTWVSSSNTGTSPLIADTDEDGSADGVETNTGVWLSATSTGTNPNDPDCDKDGLQDGAETNTGIYVDRFNAGSNPYLADTDNDGAGDWYEACATFTNPSSAAQTSPIPYPLPKPDGSAGVSNKPVKVYIIMGQSNATGMARVNGTLPGTLETIVKRENRFPNLLDGSNNWLPRNDVLYRRVAVTAPAGPLAPGQGESSTQIGPELGFGQVMGWFHDEPVLILKASQGNRSLGVDFLPPGSTRWDYNGYTHAGYGDSPEQWLIGSIPVPSSIYGGKQYDICFHNLPDYAVPPPSWAIGTSYVGDDRIAHKGQIYSSLSNHTSDATTEPGVGANWTSYWIDSDSTAEILAKFGTLYPQWAAQGYEIAGFCWWQGHKDQVGADNPLATKYQENLVNYINAVRAEFNAPNAPFVVASIGFGGEPLSNKETDFKQVFNAQMAVQDMPQFAGTVKSIDILKYWRTIEESPKDEDYHYNQNAETYMLVGDAMGRAMTLAIQNDSVPPSPNPPTFAIAPTAVNATTTGMVATTALDISGPVQYYFENLTNSTNSGWITSTRWDSTGLPTGVSHTFRFKAKDAKNNETGWSAEKSATPGNDVTAPEPNPMTFAAPLTVLGEDSIVMTATRATDINGVLYQFVCTVGGGPNSLWQSSPEFTATGLAPGTSYTYVVRAKDSVGNTTADSAPASLSANATYTWTQTATGNQDWTTAGNWDGNGVFLSNAINQLRFFTDTTTQPAAGANQVVTNVPTSLSMKTLTLNGKGPNNTAGSSITIGTSASTWALGDGTISMVNLNSILGGGGNDRDLRYTIGANLTLVGDASGITTFAGASTSGIGALFTGNITGTGKGITKSGSSLLVFSGTNSYSGTTLVMGGVLRLASANALSGGLGTTGGTSALTLNGGVLELGAGDFSRGLGTGSSQFQITGGTSGFSAYGGPRVVTVNGDASQELTWGSTYFQPTALVLNQAFGLQATVYANGSIELRNKIDLNGATRTVQVNANKALISGDIRTSSGTAGLTKTGAGTLVLTGNNTYNGNTTISAGTLNIGSASSIGGSGFSNLSMNGGTLQITGTGLTSLSNLDSTVTFSNTAKGFDIHNAANTFTVDQVLSGTGTSSTLTKSGVGTLVLNKINTYAGATTVTGGGTLVLDYSDSVNGNGSKLSDTAALNLSGGKLVLRGGSHPEIVASIALAANTGNSISRDGGSSATLANAGVLTTAALSNLAIAEAGIVSTTSANANGIQPLGLVTVGSHFASNVSNLLQAYGTYTPYTAGSGGGSTSVVNQLTGGGTMTSDLSSYSLRIANGGNSDVLNLNSGVDLRVSNGGTFLYAGGADNNYTIKGVGTAFVGSTSTNQPHTMNIFTGTLTVNAFLTSGGYASLAKAGAGTLVAGGANAYTGATYVQQGVLRLANNTGAGTIAGGIFVQGGAALELSQTTSVMPANISIGAEALTLTGTGISNNGALRNFGGSNTYGGLITIGASGARINADATTSLTLTGGIATTAIQDVTFGGAGDTSVSTTGISGSGAVIKDGAGTLNLIANNTYTGATTISGGTLVLAGGTQATTSISFTGGSLGLDTGVTVTAASAAVNLTNGTIKVTGSTGAASYTLLTAASITGAPVLATSVPGYELQVIEGATDQLLLVQSSVGSSYDTWSGGAPFDGDANGDGVDNGLAFLLGAATPGANATGLLPTVSNTGGNLVMSFTCLATADRGTATLTLEYDGDLAGTWLSVPVPGAVGAPNPIVENTTTGSVSFVATNGGTNGNGDALIHVVATISDATESASGKLFGRVKGVNP